MLTCQSSPGITKVSCVALKSAPNAGVEGKAVVADLTKIFIASVSMFPSEGEIEKVSDEVRRPLVLGTIGLKSSGVRAVLEG